jgi:O-methyltransferase domain
MQDWNDAECTHILRQLVPALEHSYSKVLLNEFILPDKGAHWALTCLDWELMLCLSARQRTEVEFRALLAAAGLKVVGIFKHPHSADSLIDAELP